MGVFLAVAHGSFNTVLFVFCLLTTTFLQILSNLANDYGDSVHGADRQSRVGPLRAVQTGAISARQMKRAVFVFASLSLLCGLLLVWEAFHNNLVLLFSFVALGLLSIAAAIGYTMGKRPYGYVGLGDLFVLIFFGWVGVGGTYFLFTQAWQWSVLLPASAVGLLATGVLNVNNIRDIESDRAAGKQSIPVRLGRRRAIVYHQLLLGAAVVLSLIDAFWTGTSPYAFLFLLVVPGLLFNGWAVATRPAARLDPLLRQLALTTLVFVILKGLGGLL